jgi:hypothetical protein
MYSKPIMRFYEMNRAHNESTRMDGVSGGRIDPWLGKLRQPGKLCRRAAYSATLTPMLHYGARMASGDREMHTIRNQAKHVVQLRLYLGYIAVR